VVGTADENLSGTQGFHKRSTLAPPQLSLRPTSVGLSCHLDLGFDLVLSTHFLDLVPGSVVAIGPVVYLAGTDLVSGIDLVVGNGLAFGSVAVTDLAIGFDLEVGTLVLVPSVRVWWSTLPLLVRAIAPTSSVTWTVLITSAW